MLLTMADSRLVPRWRRVAYWFMKPIPFPAMTFEPLDDYCDDRLDRADAGDIVKAGDDEARREGERPR